MLLLLVPVLLLLLLLLLQAITLDGSNVMNQWIDVSLHLTKQSARERRVGGSSEPPFGPGVRDGLVVLLKGLPFSLTQDEVRPLPTLTFASPCDYCCCFGFGQSGETLRDYEGKRSVRLLLECAWFIGIRKLTRSRVTAFRATTAVGRL